MAKINELDDFINITSNITSFSHAYLFDVSKLDIAFPYIKEFAKMIICGKKYQAEEYSDICYQIDNDEFDDLYVVNPDTIGINTEEINKLLNYMETKSLRDNGKRVYIIYGFERLSRDVSNKILKFLEEPNDNIYALLMTENIDKILSTIISRCQTLSLTFDVEKDETDKIKSMKAFLECLFNKKNTTIAYENTYFGDIIGNRLAIYESFEVIESLLSSSITKKCGKKIDDIYILNILDNISIESLINILDITNKLKCLVKSNINLNLLIDRYIIEVTRELMSCRK